MKLQTILLNHRGSWKYYRRFGEYDGIFVGTEFYFYTCQNMVCFFFQKTLFNDLVAPFYLVVITCSHYLFQSGTSLRKCIE